MSDWNESVDPLWPDEPLGPRQLHISEKEHGAGLSCTVRDASGMIMAKKMRIGDAKEFISNAEERAVRKAKEKV